MNYEEPDEHCDFGEFEIEVKYENWEPVEFTRSFEEAICLFDELKDRGDPVRIRKHQISKFDESWEVLEQANC